MLRTLPLAAAASLLLAPAALAQVGASSTIGPLPVTGSVPTLCSVGTVAGGNTTFAVGQLINSASGFLSTTLSVPSKTVSGSWCNTQSAINVAASPLSAQTQTQTPPTGFSRIVNFTATATGWSTTPAAFTTGAATNTAATQPRATPFASDLTVAIGSFGTAGGDTLRLVADTNYSGSVTVTLSVTP